MGHIEDIEEENRLLKDLIGSVRLFILARAVDNQVNHDRFPIAFSECAHMAKEDTLIIDKIDELLKEKDLHIYRF